MKRKFIKYAVMLTLAVIISASAFSVIAASGIENSRSFNPTRVLETKFLNMLNHNYVYAADFDSIDTIVNNSAVALLDKKSGDYISADILNGYLLDMYGVEIKDFSLVNGGFCFKEGYAYILPCGYTKYHHTAAALTENPSGTYTLTTKVKIETHDAQSYTAIAETVFVKNPDSAFGYNIVTSELK